MTTFERDRPSLMTAPRLEILRDLTTGPRTLAELPHRWPFTRAMLEDMVEEMVRHGLVERVPSPRVAGVPAYGLTRAGWAVAAPMLPVDRRAVRAAG